jgi:hypothetical protein
VNDQLQKCVAWFEVKGITVSRQRFLNWLNNPKYNPKPILIPKEKVEIARTQCKWCGEIYFINKEHKCKEDK